MRAARGGEMKRKRYKSVAESTAGLYEIRLYFFKRKESGEGGTELMKTQSILVRGREARLLTCHTAVVGSGAAATPPQTDCTRPGSGILSY